MAHMNPRVEIDTLPPFESVKEAVDRFGGGGPWLSHHFSSDVNGMDVEQLEREIMIKQQQTFKVSKELENARCYVESLKLQESFTSSMEFNEVKVNLHKTSLCLAKLQASVENLNRKIRCHKDIIQKRETKQNAEMISGMAFVHEVNFEGDLMEASRYEVLKAMLEIERTNNSIKMVEMRLNAARKMEEAATAVEAIAIAEGEKNRNTLLEHYSNSSKRITLTFEDYIFLTEKAKKAEKYEETINGDNRSTKLKLSAVNSNDAQEYREVMDSSFRSKGEGVGWKVIEQDDVRMGTRVENNSTRGHVTLSQMLSERNEDTMHPTKTAMEGNLKKQQYFLQRKKFGFIQVPLPTKKKTLQNSRT